MIRATALVNVMDRAARKAGRALVRDFGEVELLQVSKKGPADFVSSADLRAEEILRQELSHARPDFVFVGEEGGGDEGGAGAGTGKTRWLVDPLDGTTNFLHGVPHFAISIAVVEENRVTAGLVYAPVHDEVYWAANGAGAFVGRRRLRVSARTQLRESLIATGIPYLGRGDHKHFLSTQETVMGRVAGIRRFGSAALDLAYVAAGRFDGYWEYGLKPWDIAAGIILVREAGGFVTDPRGGEEMLASGNIVAGNGAIHTELRALLAPLGLPAG